MTATVVANVSEPERRTLSKIKFYLFAYFLLGSLFVQLDKTNIGFAQLTMGRELGLKATAFGLAAGIFSLAAVLMQVPSAKLFEIFGARRWLTGIAIGWGGTCLAQAFVRTPTQLVVLRFLLGIFEAGLFPCLIILISIWFRGEQHGQAVGFMQLGVAMAGIVGGPIGGWMLGRAFFGLAGWRNLFLWEGGVTVVWAIIASLTVNDDPKRASWLKPDEREFITKYLAEDQAQKSSHGLIEKTNVWEALKDWRILVLIVSSGCAGWTFATFAFFSPTLLKMAGKGISNQYVGLLSMGPYIVMAVVGLWWGGHSDKHHERHWHVVGPLALGVVAVLLFPVLSKQPLLAMLGLAMAQAADAGFLVTFWPTANMIVGKKTIIKTTALIRAGSLLAGFLAPIAFGWLMDVTGGKTSLGLYETAGVYLLNFLLMNIFFFKYKAQQKQARQEAAIVTLG